jgi:hypothetical protein
VIVFRTGWPEPYIGTVISRTFGDFPAKITVYTLYVYAILAIPIFCLFLKLLDALNVPFFF